ncbi:MAG TPA: cytochrome c3 family protein [Gemmatimonadaceae bacterium]
MRLLTWLAALLLSATISGEAQQRARFPHDKHAKLFPTCASCHAGIVAGTADRAYPPTASCASCHNDRDAKAVVWTAPARQATNLRFNHPVHAAKSAAEGGGAATPCVSCHSLRGDTAWMRVGTARAESCIGCHTHRASEHLAETAACTTCHTSLANARELPTAAIAAFPKPATHTQPDFASNHAPRNEGEVARCATCHAKESCVRCHANASNVRAIAQIASDARVASLMQGRTASYAAPASHTSTEWRLTHGADATKSIQRCANCHTRPSCTSCHTGSQNTRAARVIATLPQPAPHGARGVQLEGSRVHAANFLASHKTSAAAQRLDCAGCHQQRECTSCHAGASSRRFHAVDFVSRHAGAAFGQEQTCASCHRTETFCRSCHLKSSIATTGARSGVAHAGQPSWLLQHGQAARQGLASCTTCHQQRDCLRCHSDLGRKINPHGPDFDASKISARNKVMCMTCHLKDPLVP